MEEEEGDAPLSALEYSVYACSSYSGQYVPENILVECGFQFWINDMQRLISRRYSDPQDQRSRWSGGNRYTRKAGLSTSSPAIVNTSSESSPARDKQWLILRLASRAILRQITFGKYCRSHPCNVREFKIYVGQTPDMRNMSLVHWGGLKNDASAETFDVCYKDKNGIVLPCEYICIEPISAHSSNYNVSIWHVALHGQDGDELVRETSERFNEFRETATTRLILKYLRQRGMQEAFEAVQRAAPSTSVVQLEHPSLTQLHDYLVKQGDFDAAEQLISEIAFPSSGSSLFDEYCSSAQPRAEWTRLDTLPDVLTWDGEAPSPRGGHQMVLLRPNSNATSLRDDTDDIISIDLEEDDEAAIYLFGGWDGTKELSDFWRFSLKHQRWEIIQESQASSGMGEAAWPSARSCHQMCVDETTGDIYLSGKFIEASESASMDSPLDPPQPVQAESALAAVASMETSGVGRGTGGRRAVGAAPGLDRSSISAAPRPSAQQEQPESARNRIDLWVYHTRGSLQNTWEKLTSDTVDECRPDQLFDHQMVFDAASRKIFIFGGKCYRNGAATYPGLYAYFLDRKVWVMQTSDSATMEHPIPSRTGHTMLLDPVDRQLIVFAGQRGQTYLNDLWTFDIQKIRAKCIDKAYGENGGPDAGFTARAVLDASRREFTLLSGLVRDRAPPHETTVKNNVWIYNLQSGEWRRVDHDVDGAEEPKPRFAHQFVFDPARDEYYLFGGNPAEETVSTRLGDFWRLKLYRAGKYDILQRCQFIIRRCRFYEMCEQTSCDPMNALLYIQSHLSSVVGPEDQQDLLACTSYLLSRQPGTKNAEELRKAAWQRRSETFEDLLQFLPVSAKQPQEDLAETCARWEGVGV